jgi:hypothetical protein
MQLPDPIHSLTHGELVERAQARKLRGIFKVEDEAYHGGPGLSSTRLKKILRSPAHAKAVQVETPALALGRAVHCAVLEPEKFATFYVQRPDVDGRTKEGKAARAEFEASLSPEHVIISAADAEMIAGIARSLAQSATFASLVEGAAFELAAFSPTVVEYGHEQSRYAGKSHVIRKAKADLINATCIADLKTCEDANDFQRSIVRYDYHVSAAYYLDVFSEVLGEEIHNFVWIAVEKKPPYGVRFYVASSNMLKIGRQKCHQALATYAQCEATGIWPCYSDEFVDIDLPSYLTKEIEHATF